MAFPKGYHSIVIGHDGRKAWECDFQLYVDEKRSPLPAAWLKNTWLTRAVRAGQQSLLPPRKLKAKWGPDLQADVQKTIALEKTIRTMKRFPHLALARMFDIPGETANPALPCPECFGLVLAHKRKVCERNPNSLLYRMGLIYDHFYMPYPCPKCVKGAIEATKEYWSET